MYKGSVVMITVFVSHQQDDKVSAAAVAARLNLHQEVKVYIDVLDPHLTDDGNDLGGYFRARLSECSHLMAVVSENTKRSWWVPFEIGIATERDAPISTYAIDAVELPDYLRKWPYLRTLQEIDDYVRVAKATGIAIGTNVLVEDLRKSVSSVRRSYATRFHDDLRRALRQQ